MASVGAWAADAPLVRGVVAEFPSEGIHTVIIRSGTATENTRVRSNYDGKNITVLATPVGGAAGYHSSDPAWKETKPADWGMAYVSARFGDTLVISSKNETVYIEHHYVLADIEVSVPPNIRVVLEQTIMNGKGQPDLSKP